ncbi:hypothetical protein OG279_38150 (plasmid) [Streptomyces sp. NBC_01201]|uniref:hypothetical protein n=1 Tax=Streptomyces sp. NBC_01201 TaxID=2903770 RepID=UPI002E127FD6|nr:hypothetical protein OG279_38150 [Streptomyces sp. NBC_01201]
MTDVPLSPRPLGVTARSFLPLSPSPPLVLCGFLLLVLVFSVSYAVGTAAGPVAPGMHGTTGHAGHEPREW